MPTHSQEELIQITDEAFAQRLKGNTLFKEGDLKGALREYHAVLLRLKGLDSALQSAFGSPAPEVIITPKDDAEEKAKAEESKEPTLQEKVKQAIGLTYLNSAAIHIKNENFKRALECADSALKIDENNDKAKFRAAQARIGMGEISKGKAALEELQKKTPDVAIANALKQLAADEKTRAAQAKSQFTFSQRECTARSLPPPPTTVPPSLPASTSLLRRLPRPPRRLPPPRRLAPRPKRRTLPLSPSPRPRSPPPPLVPRERSPPKRPLKLSFPPLPQSQDPPLCSFSRFPLAGYPPPLGLCFAPFRTPF
ncbi:hypothetical protein BCR35DRAFT_308109 [Leucosporidium creatinivorum]|uniref:peptidylprolyl isomerase n=1 Tax=Leucosporidium creatinivorum TaxID=106004 RepID=A0A1Y2EDB2_9BASI|nr:hypothetical protein BCR35DRAFT_308109 [Leucosporidium creatinivorum]